MRLYFFPVAPNPTRVRLFLEEKRSAGAEISIEEVPVDLSQGDQRRPEHLARLKRVVEQTLEGSLKPWRELARRKSKIPSRLRVFKVAPRVLVDNKASAHDTVIEVNGRDRPGLLYDLTQALSKLQLMIHGARIATYGERAVDVFYVQDALGDKIEAPARLERIRTRLLEALGVPEGAAPAKKPAKTTAEKPKPAKKAKKKAPAKKKTPAKKKAPVTGAAE